MRQALPFLLFLVLNFGGLAIGGRYTGPGVTSEWYQLLAKAPWTPPGWVFGAAWTTVMLGFSWFMAALWKACPTERRPILAIGYAKAWVFNAAWNALFFSAHLVGWALLDLIVLLSIVVWLGTQGWYHPAMRTARWALLPYPCWLLVALSLNAYPWWMGV